MQAQNGTITVSIAMAILIFECKTFSAKGGSGTDAMFIDVYTFCGSSNIS